MRGLLGKAIWWGEREVNAGNSASERMSNAPRLKGDGDEMDRQKKKVTVEWKGGQEKGNFTDRIEDSSTKEGL